MAVPSLEGPAWSSCGFPFLKCGFMMMRLFNRSMFYLFALGSPSYCHPLLLKIHFFSQILLLEGDGEK